MYPFFLLFFLIFSTTSFAIDLDFHIVRNQINQKIMSIQAEKPEVDIVTDLIIEMNERKTPVRIYQPQSEEESLPILLFIHGGAWVAGNIETHDNMARYLCQKSESVVISVDYSNSPEVKFPYALEQCFDALQWSEEHAKEYQGDPSRLAVIGDSAGGNLAAALCLLARDRQGPDIKMQILVNPSLDLTGSNIPPSEISQILLWYALQYLNNLSEATHSYASPLLAADVSNLPATLILLAEKDVLKEEGLQYAERLKKAGVHTNAYTQWGTNHLAGEAARASHKAKESLDIAVTALLGTYKNQRNF